MNYLAASCRGINIEISFLSMQALEYLPTVRQVKLIYPDTLPTFGTGQVTLSGLFPAVMRSLR